MKSEFHFDFIDLSKLVNIINCMVKERVLNSNNSISFQEFFFLILRSQRKNLKVTTDL